MRLSYEKMNEKRYNSEIMHTFSLSASSSVPLQYTHVIRSKSEYALQKRSKKLAFCAKRFIHLCVNTIKQMSELVFYTGSYKSYVHVLP